MIITHNTQNERIEREKERERERERERKEGERKGDKANVTHMNTSHTLIYNSVCSLDY